MRVSAFTKYGSLAASTRQRLLQYIPHLEAAGIDVDFHPLLPNEYVRNLAGGDSYSRVEVAASYLDRMRTLRSRGLGDVLWIYAELFPYLPAGFEKLAFKSGRPVIYDFDDAFFHAYDAHHRPMVRKLLGGKLEPLLTGAAACCCGNRYLQDYALQFCPDSIVLPTVVDTSAYKPAQDSDDLPDPLVIGWIGSPSTWGFMQPLLPLLAELSIQHGVRVRVVGAGAKAEGDRFEGLDVIEWQEATEVQEVQAMDIGIMPLPDQLWARGKSGYKLIQYMACGLPVVASPVGVNEEIVQEGVSGFLADNLEEWRSALVRLIQDPALRMRMGKIGRRRADDLYSVKAHAPRFVDLIKAVAGGTRVPASAQSERIGE